MSAAQLIKAMDYVRLDELADPTQNVRTIFETDEEFKNLVESIRARGLVTPLDVKEEDGKYKVIAGSRRLAALKEVYKNKPDVNVPVVVLRITEAIDEYTVSSIENIHRSNLSIEELSQMIAHYKDMGLKQKDIAKRINKSEGWVSMVAQGKTFHEQYENKKSKTATSGKMSEEFLCPSCGNMILRKWDQDEKKYLYDFRPTVIGEKIKEDAAEKAQKSKKKKGGEKKK